MRLRRRDLVLDVDPRNFEAGDDPVRRLSNDIASDLTAFPTVLTGGGGRHIYMVKPTEPSIRGALKTYRGLEFKTAGQQVVAAGSVHESGLRYRWDDDPLALPLRLIRPAPQALLDLIARQPRDAFSEPGSITPGELELMLGGLDVLSYSGEQDLWLSLMMACHYATGGDARDEWIAWCVSDPRYADHGPAIGTRWDSLRLGGTGKKVTEKTLFKALVDVGRADLLPIPDAAQDFPDSPEDEVIAGGLASGLIKTMNDRFCAVLEGGRFSIYMEDTDDLFDPPRKVWSSMSREAFRHYHANELITSPDGKQRVTVADAWLRHPNMRKYPGIVMDPSGKIGDKLNLWRGWAVEPRAGDWSLMRRLIDEILCSGDERSSEFVRRWIAFMLQFPAERPEAVIAFRGAEGTGKGTLGRALMKIAGAHGMTVSSPNQFAGRFNAHLRNVAFLFADEAFWPGHKEAEGTLKQLVTEPIISYEPKGKDITQGRNLVHLMMASNEDWMLPAGLDARRFAVFDVADAVRNDRDFFAALDRQLSDGGLAAMVHDMMTIDLDGWHPSQHIPQTQALADQKLLSMDPPHLWWREMLERGSLPGMDEAAWQAGPVVITSGRADLLDDYAAFLLRNREFSLKATHKALATAGHSLGLETSKQNRSTERAWVLPPLSQARQNFEARLGAVGMFE